MAFLTQLLIFLFCLLKYYRCIYCSASSRICVGLHWATSSKFYLCAISETTNKAAPEVNSTSCNKTDATAEQYCTPPRFDFNLLCSRILTTAAISFDIRCCLLVSCGASPLHYEISFDGSHQNLVIIITLYWELWNIWSCYILSLCCCWCNNSKLSVPSLFFWKCFAHW